jgi:tetratricopeptide (TPR) repeat protein
MGVMRLVALLAAVCGAARADGGDALARARIHFDAGKALYQLGNYTDAIREFSAGYQLAPRPQFLINLGQAYRKLGELPKARDMYRRFVHDVPPGDPDLPQAQQVLADLEREIAATAPPAGDPVPPPVVVPPPIVAAPAPVLTAPAPAPRDDTRRRRLGLGLGLGLSLGAAAVAAIVVGVVLGPVDYWGRAQASCAAPCIGVDLR